VRRIRNVNRRVVEVAMISQAATRNGARVTFTVAAKAPVSVVGDFNGWDPSAHPLRGHKDGLRSATITLAPGEYSFRYLAHGGIFFDEPDANRFAANAHGGIDNVVIVAAAAKAPAKKKTATKAAAKKSTAKKASGKSNR
jgi:1,4-alpha-glucan branching enzyme